MWWTLLFSLFLQILPSLFPEKESRAVANTRRLMILCSPLTRQTNIKSSCYTGHIKGSKHASWQKFHADSHVEQHHRAQEDVGHEEDYHIRVHCVFPVRSFRRAAVRKHVTRHAWGRVMAPVRTGVCMLACCPYTLNSKPETLNPKP